MFPRTIPTAEPFFFPGDRTGCMLVHGFTGTPKEMRLLGESLAEKGRTVLGIRLAAHATRPEDMIRARWPDWLASLEDGWNILSGCTDSIFVMGLSMGGILTLLFASHYPVAGVVAMATPHHLPADPRIRFLKPLSLVKRYIPKGPSGYFDEEAFRDHICYPEDPVRGYAEVRDLIIEMQKALPKITAPALLIFSKQDQTVTAGEGHMDLIYAALGSHDKQRVWIENSSHVITRDAQRQQVFQLAAEFVEQHSQANT